MTNEVNYAACCVDFHGVGVLICGKSGSGKSSLVLSLIEKGALLVSDDRTILFKKGGVLMAKAPPLIKGLLEVRGIGIVKGFETKEQTPVQLIIRLIEGEPNRLPEKIFENIMDCSIMSFSLFKNDFALTNKVAVAIKLIENKLSLIKQI